MPGHFAATIDGRRRSIDPENRLSSDARPSSPNANRDLATTSSANASGCYGRPPHPYSDKPSQSVIFFACIVIAVGIHA